MSEFDKEAERERLREKYERDKQKREAAEKMSELMLKGATMTNAHCSSCGDPVFRYDGQEFCATCEKPIERAESTDGEDVERDDTVEVANPNEESRIVFGGDDSAAVPPTSQEDHEQDSTSQDGADGERVETSETGVHTTPPGTRRDAPHGEIEADEPAAPKSDRTGSVEPGLTAARESLVGTLVRFSQRAEATDDPQQAREYLRTAREAAETLAVLQSNP